MNGESLNEIQNITNTMASCEKLIFERMMGYDMEKKLKKYNHLSKIFFELTAMFQIFAMIRLRNNTLLVLWGIIGAALSHGNN